MPPDWNSRFGGSRLGGMSDAELQRVEAALDALLADNDPASQGYEEFRGHQFDRSATGHCMLSKDHFLSLAPLQLGGIGGTFRQFQLLVLKRP